MLGLELLIKGILEITKIIIDQNIEEGLGAALAHEAFKGLVKFSDEEIEKLCSLYEQFNLKKEIRQLGYYLNENKEILEFISMFLDKLESEEWIKEHGLRDDSVNAMVDLFDQELRKNTDVFNLLGDKYGALTSIWKKWIKKVWDAADQNLLIFEQMRENRFDEKSEHQELGKKIDALDSKVGSLLSNSEKTIKDETIVENRYQKYKECWTKNLFLNDLDEEDENRVEKITLEQMHIVPKYLWKTNRKPSTNLEEKIISIAENTEEDKRMLLILGQPGIGKSSLISWFINKFEDKTNREIVVYRFSDFKNLNWDVSDIADEFVHTLKLAVGDFNNKILFLDGFDEIYVKARRENILNQLYRSLVQSSNVQNLSLFVTCRENYIDNLSGVQCNYITLQAMDEELIDEYYNSYINYSKKEQHSDALKLLQSKKDIFGVPMVLYMTLALDIKIEKESSVVDVYDQIFAINNGIYDHVVLKTGPHRIQEFKEKLHCISKKFAVWMFEHKAAEAEITETAYKKIITEQLGEERVQDVLIGSYFKHCEGMNTSSVCFVHRSIYEYYLVTNFCDKLWENEESLLKNKKEFAEFWVSYFQQGIITVTICEYIKHKIKKYFNHDKEKCETFFDYMEDVLIYLVDNGFSCKETPTNELLVEKLKREGNCFSNYIILLQEIAEFREKEYILQGKNIRNISDYIKMSIVAGKNGFKIFLKEFDLRRADLSGINLSGINLRGADLRGANLLVANLSGANLSGADLEGANLLGANLSEANLEGANLEEANLREANLFRANLFRANLTGANLFRADLTGADLTGANLREANLRGANLEGANLTGANLFRAYLTGAKLDGVILDDAILGNTILTNTILDPNKQ